MDNLATKGEEAVLKGNLRELYDITRKLTGKWKQSNRLIRDAQGKLLSTTEEQAAAWAEHFKTLLNQPQLTNRCVIQPAATDLDITCEKPSKAEIRKAIGALNAGKTAGPDSIARQMGAQKWGICRTSSITEVVMQMKYTMGLSLIHI